MPFEFDHLTVCADCPLGGCLEDRRTNRVRGRNTNFRLKQSTAMACTFGQFMPGSDNDPDGTRTFDDYLNKFRSNALAAGTALYPGAFDLNSSAIAKVEGDVMELMEAGAIWAAFSAWNRYMDGGAWPSEGFLMPTGTVQAPSRKAAVLKLPRGYDTIKLFKPEVRADILAHEQSLKLRGMELGLSAPDIVGIRLPYPLPESMSCFLTPVNDLSTAGRGVLETAHLRMEGQLDARSFLFAIAVKRTTRSDRLYQPLFEANVLKYLIEFVLRGAAFQFHVHMGSFEGADVESHYTAASLTSLLRGGEPKRAVDTVYHAVSPRSTAQTILNTLPYFPV